MPERSEPQLSEQTTDVPHAGPSTARRMDTARHSDAPYIDGTGAYTPSDNGDFSVIGGFTPSDMPKGGPLAVSAPGYEIMNELGRGGMGVVYKARQLALNRIVALKMILAGGLARQKDLERFRAEALAVARFQHPNIVQIYEVGEAEGLPYFSLEYVAAGTLAGKIDRDPQDPRYAAEIGESLARAMQYAHERGIVHRDLKPANVLLADDGTPKITDFGLAKQLEGDSGQTQDGQVLGTPSYMAPEQAYGDSATIGAATDVYSLGGILYDLLTGRPPFSGSSVLDTLEMVRMREPVPPGQLAGRIPADLETITLKCLQKEPSRRYDSAGALADDLRRYLDGRPILARPIGALEKTWRWAKRNPTVASLTSIVAGLLIITAVVTSILSYRLSIKKEQAEEAARLETIAKNDAEKAKEKEEIAKNVAIDEKRKAEIARDNEIAARKVTREQRELALATVRGVLLDVDNQMRNDARLSPIRRQIIDQMLLNLDKIRDNALRNPLEDRTEALAFARIGDIYIKSNRIEEGAGWLRKAYPLLKSVADDNPNDPAALFNLAGIKNQLGDVEWRLGSSDKGHEFYIEALAHRQPRVALLTAMLQKQDEASRAVPILKSWVPLLDEMIRLAGLSERDIINANHVIGDSYGLIAFSHLRLGNLQAAIDNYLDADKAYDALPVGRKSSLLIRRARAEIQGRLGDAKLRQNKFDEAKKHYDAALTERQELLRQTPSPREAYLVVQSDVGQSRLYHGDYYLMAHNDTAAASREYQAALELFSGLHQEEPDNLDLSRRVAATHYRLGYVASKQTTLATLGGKTMQKARAVMHFNESLKLRLDLAKVDSRDTQTQIELMLVQARLGQIAVVEKAAAGLLEQAGEDRQVLFQVACGLAIAGAGDSVASQRCREGSLKLIANLIDKGWKDCGSLEFDPDLEAIRGDKKFGDLVARMKSK